MANPKHEKIIRQGVDAWNKWREENEEVRPDLSFIDLRGADLRGANLIGIDLSNANLKMVNISVTDLLRVNLRCADLSEADLSGADLREVDFNGSNLSEADLTEAFLSLADLSLANLKEANLTEADFNGANLSEADLRESKLFRTKIVLATVKGMKVDGSRMGGTTIAGVDLRGVEGLESVSHLWSSFIDISTIIRSEGEIPEVFLRGAGWPDEFIQFILPLARKGAIQYYSGFISYSSNDENFVKRLHNDLQGEGVRVWFAPEDLKIGDEFDKVINREIRLRDKLILVLSENSVKSDWVAFEVEQAEEEEKKRHPDWPEDEPLEKPVLFPIQIDDSLKECNEQWARKIKRHRHIGDFRGWKNADDYKKAFERLLRDLKGGKGSGVQKE